MSCIDVSSYLIQVITTVLAAQPFPILLYKKKPIRFSVQKKERQKEREAAGRTRTERTAQLDMTE